MAFVDEIQVHMQAGKGGDGVIRWRREKFIPKGGPAGGNGGRGGEVIVRALRNMHTLAKYSHQKLFKAEDGFPGEAKSCHGRSGADLVLDFPVGSIITNLSTGERISLDTDGQQVTLLKPGKGGWGNEHFKSSINTTPRKYTQGTEGEEADFKIELELFADIGLVGLPNAGKSSLLNALTNAQAKIGDYAFTTLDPNLGDLYGHIIADIPGLIEGASEGKGLGTRFLKHIKRTRKLVHLVSFENELAQVGGMMKVYKEIRKELETFDTVLGEKDEIILLTKTDVVDDPKLIAKKVAEFKKLKKEVLTVSLYDTASIDSLSKKLIELLRK